MSQNLSQLSTTGSANCVRTRQKRSSKKITEIVLKIIGCFLWLYQISKSTVLDFLSAGGLSWLAPKTASFDKVQSSDCRLEFRWSDQILGRSVGTCNFSISRSLCFWIVHCRYKINWIARHSVQSADLGAQTTLLGLLCLFKVQFLWATNQCRPSEMNTVSTLPISSDSETLSLGYSTDNRSLTHDRVHQTQISADIFIN